MKKTTAVPKRPIKIEPIGEPKVLAHPDMIAQILTVGEAFVAGSYRAPKSTVTCALM